MFSLKKPLIPLIGIVLILAHFALGIKAINHFSPTYDEPIHLTAGYVYLNTGDYKLNGLHHPAFSEMWPALGLLGLNVSLPTDHAAWTRQTWQALDQYQFADTFLYENSVNHETLIRRGRMMQLVLSVILGITLLIVVGLIGGWERGLLAMGFWAFSPSLLAHGTLITTDLAFVTFFFAFFAFLSFWPKWWGLLGAGLSLGLCFASKYPAIIIGPSLAVIGFWKIVQASKEERLRDFMKEIYSLKSFLRAGAILLSAVLVLLMIYRITEISVFWKGLNLIFSRAQAGRSSFFFGEYGTEGWLAYFPTAFLLKTPIPTLIALVIVLGLSIKKKLKLNPFFIIPPLVFFAAAMTSKVQIGHRYILAVYPFIFALIGLYLPLLKNKKWIFSLGLFFWLAGSTILTAPHFLSYFNESIGGSKNGYKYFTDSNVDWGQDLKKLAAVLEAHDGNKDIFLSYFGVANPEAYGIRFIDVGSDVIAGRKDKRSEITKIPDLFAVSLTNYQATYYSQKNVFDWLKKRTPISRIGHSMFLYDISNDPEAIYTLMALSGMTKK